MNPTQKAPNMMTQDIRFKTPSTQGFFFSFVFKTLPLSLETIFQAKQGTNPSHHKD